MWGLHAYVNEASLSTLGTGPFALYYAVFYQVLSPSCSPTTRKLKHLNRWGCSFTTTGVVPRSFSTSLFSWDLGLNFSPYYLI